MNWSSIWELTKINILYSNPQALEAIRKKRAKKSQGDFSGPKSMLRQQGVSMLIMLVVYSYLFININYAQMPGQFTVQLAMFMMISLIYGFTGFFSIFYDSNDTKLYLPLPLKASEVYIAKLLSGQGLVLTYLVPILSLLGISYWQLTGSWLSLLLVLPVFALIVAFVNLLALSLTHLIGEFLARSPYKKMISTVLMTLSTLLAVAAIFFVQFSSQNQMMSEHPTDLPNIYLIRGYYDLVANPLSLATGFHFGLTLLFTLVLVVFVHKRVIPSYFKQILAMEQVKSSKKKGKIKPFKELSLNRTLIKHHLSTLAEGTLIVQTYIMPLIYIIAFLGPSMQDGFSFADLDNHFFGIAFLLGSLLGIYFGSPNSFLGVGLSLERDNYTFLKTLPFNFKAFIIQKFFLLSLLQHGLPLVIYLSVALFVFQVPLGLTLAFLLGVALSAMLAGQYIFWRDSRLLNLNWQNINQLFSRGKGNLLLGILSFVVVFLVALAVIVSLGLSHTFGHLLVGTGLVLFIGLLEMVLQVFIYLRFWKKL